MVDETNARYGAFSSLAIVFILILWIWTLLPQGLFTGTDGRLYRAMIAQTIALGDIFSTTNINYVQGGFNQALPMNVAFGLSYLPFAIFSETNARFVASAIALFFHMASSAWVSRLVGVPPMLIPISVLTALLLQIYPFQYEFSTTVQFLINPGVFFSIAQFTLVVGVLLTKRFGAVALFAKYVIVTVLLAWAAISDTLWFALNLIFFAPFLLTAVMSHPWRMALIHGCLLLGAFVILWILGPLQYVFVVMQANARSIFASEIGRGDVDFSLTSSLFASRLGLSIYLLIFAACLVGLFMRRRILFLFCGTVLAYLAILVVGSAIYIAAGERWAFPAPIYIETGTLHLMCAAAFAVLGRALGLTMQATRKPAARAAVIMAALVFLVTPPAFVAYYAVRIVPERAGIYKEDLADEKNISGILRAESGLDDFRKTRLWAGSIAFGCCTPGYATDQWLQGVPTANEYGQLTPPWPYVLGSRLAFPKDMTPRINGTPFLLFNANIYRSLGSRIFLTPDPVSDAQLDLVRTIDVVKFAPEARALLNEVSSLLVYRFRAPQPVLSPTQVHLAGTWEEVLKVFSDPAFDVRRDVALSTPIGSQLRPALSATLTAVDGRLRVDVDTDGPSLIVLPIHFSTCWHTTSIDSPQLLNANGGFVGFVAPKSTSVMLEFGLSVWNSKCRRDDLVYWRQQAATIPPRVSSAAPLSFGQDFLHRGVDAFDQMVLRAKW
ncbi:hypothetical protein [Bradyrhizobium sp. dw_411]|uniref:hypothetical protein n=1 Tax=Bradyrhizobium sp. dw_411 TaxID=2720082 RepID=UPI001BCE80B5|nr:hypothetical protein [Bradyrhizobium sp. dw_411]